MVRRSAGGLGVLQLIVPGELAAHVRDAVSAVDAKCFQVGIAVDSPWERHQIHERRSNDE